MRSSLALAAAAVMALLPGGTGPSAAAASQAPQAGATGAATVDDGLFAAELPFRVGEDAEYSVTFGPIRVGRARLRVEALETIRGTPAHRLSMELKGGVPLYRLDDRTVSWLAVEPYRSLRFEQVLREGGYRRHRRWELYHETLTTTREDWDEDAEAYRPHPSDRDLPIPAGALDEISYLYLIRTLPLEVGRRYIFNRYFESDGNPVVIEVLRKERVRVPAGTFATVVVRPTIQAGGLFGEDGQAEVFISDDERRLIVQLKTRMRVGTLDMFLRDFQLGEEDEQPPEDG